MKKLIFLLALLPALSFSQVSTYFTHKAFVVAPNKEVKDKIETDVKIKLDFTLKVISIVSAKSEENYSFSSYETKDLNDGAGKRLFISLDSTQPYETMMVWIVNDSFCILLSPGSKGGNSLLFKDCKPL